MLCMAAAGDKHCAQPPLLYMPLTCISNNYVNTFTDNIFKWLRTDYSHYVMCIACFNVLEIQIKSNQLIFSWMSFYSKDTLAYSPKIHCIE